MFVTYANSPGWLNEDVHDIQFGASVYDSPQQYIRLSPEFQMPKTTAALLFEAGARASAVNMIGAAKAARREGNPAEYLIYPAEGHNLRQAKFVRQSALVNLDWFRFWLQDIEDPIPEKTEQYKRWRQMRGDSCERWKAESMRDLPHYCEAAW